MLLATWITGNAPFITPDVPTISKLEICHTQVSKVEKLPLKHAMQDRKPCFVFTTTKWAVTQHFSHNTAYAIMCQTTKPVNTAVTHPCPNTHVTTSPKRPSTETTLSGMQVGYPAVLRLPGMKLSRSAKCFQQLLKIQLHLNHGDLEPAGERPRLGETDVAPAGLNDLLHRGTSRLAKLQRPIMLLQRHV